MPRPSPEAARHLVALPIDVHSGQRLGGGGDDRFDFRTNGSRRASVGSGGFMEYFRVDERGRVNDTQDRLTSRGFGFGGDADSNNPFPGFPSWFGGNNNFGPPRNLDGSPELGYPRTYQSPPAMTQERDYEGRPIYRQPPTAGDRPIRRSEPGGGWRGRSGF